MSDTAQTQETSSDDSVMPENLPKWARDEIGRRDEKIAKQDETIKGLTEKVKTSAFESLGIKIKEGLGKKIFDLYDGPPEEADIATFAQEFEYPIKTQEQRVAEAVQTADQQITTVVANSVDAGSVDDLDAQIAEAEAKGEWFRAAELKQRRYYPQQQ